MPTPKLRQQFVAALEDLADPAVVADVSRFFRADPNGHSRGNKVLGVSHGKIFAVAKHFIDMPLADIDRLLGSRVLRSPDGGSEHYGFPSPRETHFAGASQGPLRSVPPAS